MPKLSMLMISIKIIAKRVFSRALSVILKIKSVHFAIILLFCRRHCCRIHNYHHLLVFIFIFYYVFKLRYWEVFYWDPRELFPVFYPSKYLCRRIEKSFRQFTRHIWRKMEQVQGKIEQVQGQIWKERPAFR